MPWDDDDDDQPRFRRGRRRRDDEPPEAGADSVMIYPVVSAAYYGSVPAVGAALRAGGDVDELDAKEHWRPLHAAVFTDSEDVVDYLIGVRAEVNLPGPSGMAPLHMAARDNQMEICRLLLAARAEIGATDEAGRTALDLAAASASHKSRHMLEAFRNGGSDADVALARAAVDADVCDEEPDPLAAARAAAARSRAERQNGASKISSAPLMRIAHVLDEGEDKLAVPSLHQSVESNEVGADAVNETRRSSGPVFGSMVDPDNPRNNPDLTIEDLDCIRE